MKHTEDIIVRLLRIREARRLCDSHALSSDDVQILRDFIAENRRQIPSFALAHFDRLESSGKSGLAKVLEGKCSACAATVPQDEIEYLNKNRNIGVCDNCYAFLYMPDEKFEDTGYVKRLIGK